MQRKRTNNIGCALAEGYAGKKEKGRGTERERGMKEGVEKQKETTK